MLDKVGGSEDVAHVDIAPRPSFDPEILSAALQLSLHQGRVLSLLLSGSLTSMRHLEQKACTSAESRRATICRLRQKLHRMKVRIHSHHGLGYSIPPEDRERIAVLVERFKGQFI